MQMRWLAVPVLMAAFSGAAMAASCPPLLEGQLPKLRAKESIDLCQRFAGKPLGDRQYRQLLRLCAAIQRP